MDHLTTWGRESMLMISVVVVPAIAVWAALVAVRARGTTLGRAVALAMIDVGLAVSLIVIATLGLRPGPGIPGGFEQWNLVPFRDLARALDGRPWGLGPAVTGVLGNLLLFAPFGFFFALWFRRVPWPSLVVLSLALATSIEVAQALIATGRSSDVTDIVTNTAGATLGFATARLLVGQAAPPDPAT